MTTSAPNRAARRAKKYLAKIITITNQKGGVGKTTISFHLAVFLARLGFRVLVVDLDGQGNLTSCLAPGKHDGGTMTSMLFREDEITTEPLQTQWGVDIIYCLEGDMTVYEVEMAGISQVEPFYEHITRLSEGYDFTILDTPPTYGVKMMAACISADHIFAPVELAGFALNGVRALDECMATISGVVGKEIGIDGLICNKYDSRNSLHESSLNDIREQVGDLVFNTVLRDSAPIDKAILMAQPVWKTRKSGNERAAALMMIDLMKEIALRIKVPKVVIDSFKPN
jgi:chromosome partitioning protein